MRWRKLGRIVPAPPPLPWAASHGMVPVADPQADGRTRVYFSPRDAGGRSHVALATFEDMSSPPRYEPDPVLGPGPLGAFDDSGVNASSLLYDEGRLLLYYIGWNRGVTVPFTTSIGCAVSEDAGRSFRRVSPAPVLGRSSVDPFFTTSPWVLAEDGRYRMWYASCVEWQVVEGVPRHRYHIRYAESGDGLHWEPTARVCIDFAGEEYAIARPCVVRDGDRYRMWYSYRGEAYRIGYAESGDGLVWERLDDRVGIDVSQDGWDAEMIEYPCVFEQGGRRYMLYNGNGYGETGVGCAVLEAE